MKQILLLLICSFLFTCSPNDETKNHSTSNVVSPIIPEIKFSDFLNRFEKVTLPFQQPYVWDRDKKISASAKDTVFSVFIRSIPLLKLPTGKDSIYDFTPSEYALIWGSEKWLPTNNDSSKSLGNLIYQNNNFILLTFSYGGKSYLISYDTLGHIKNGLMIHADSIREDDSPQRDFAMYRRFCINKDLSIEISQSGYIDTIGDYTMKFKGQISNDGYFQISPNHEFKINQDGRRFIDSLGNDRINVKLISEYEKYFLFVKKNGKIHKLEVLEDYMYFSNGSLDSIQIDGKGNPEVTVRLSFQTSHSYGYNLGGFFDYHSFYQIWNIDKEVILFQGYDKQSSSAYGADGEDTPTDNKSWSYKLNINADTILISEVTGKPDHKEGYYVFKNGKYIYKK